MSKRGYISRYLLIIKKLKSKPYCSYDELQRYIEKQYEFLQMQDDSLNLGFSTRTLQRDIKEINTIFGFTIEYSRSDKGYFIADTEVESMNFERMMESFDLFNSLNLARDLTPYIHLEKRKPHGTENLYGLLHAIKNKLLIKFTYQKFWDEEEISISERTVEPYAIKEFRNRWYLMAKDRKDDRIKSFALDRLTNLDITLKNFKLSTAYHIDEIYKYCFGIVCPDEGEPEVIVLTFNPAQGKYIKSLPLHETQQILIDNSKELQVSLKLYVTHDLLMELLSFGENVKVLKPKSLVNEIKTIYKNASQLYKS